ncbi:sialate O-acetylesterase [Desertivirga arenae]|uniref:sialate O-acetylesterase n=1 Tax=Desertivirga arenae TaxID=2810309 RepID=UPI001F60A64F|nr:sialate O-acetylesterase [Pedobacter sp. SYSU D00823]
MKKLFSIIVVVLFSIVAKAEVVLPRILGHNMVLQREKPVKIWGTAAVGEQVSVEFKGQHLKATGDRDGKWEIILSPMKASASPSAMIISGSNTIKLENILVGEVWICSGQSNMEFTMRKNSKMAKPDTSTANSPIDELDRAHNPLIRIFLVNRKEQVKPDPQHKGWNIAQDSALRVFSAPGYFFAKELQSKLGVPVGMISAAIPGSAIEPWIPANAYTSEFFKTYKVSTGGTSFFESMIRPLAPFGVKGFIWYQGETNCFQNETLEYSYKLETLINSWRAQWNDKSLPFYYTQIAPFYYSKSTDKYPLTKETLPKFWEAQQAVMKVPHTGMITTTDLIVTPDDLHPSFKWEIGRRLAQWPLAVDYRKKVTPTGPFFKSKKVKANSVVVSYNYASNGLLSHDGKELTQFEIAGADGVYHPAKAIIKGKKVIVSSDAVKKPANVRFGWNEGGKANLYNKEGYPAMPFRSDNPIVAQFKVSAK